MSKTSTIVCAVDLSSASKQSLPLAAKLARDRGAKLVIVHQAPNRNWSMYAIITSNPERERAEAFERADKFVREIMCRSQDVEWELKVGSGNFSDIINEVAEETGADLVISARHKGKLEVLGSSHGVVHIIERLDTSGLSRPAPRAALAGI